MRSLLTLGVAAATVTAASSAAADVSSWLAIGGGYTLQHNAVASQTDRATALGFSLGVGSTPRAPIVVGGVIRTLTFFTLGTDLSLSARVASGGFARGQWGLAVDVGAVGRWWKEGDYGRYPLQGVVTLGAPWGLQVAMGAQFWNIDGDPQARGGFAALEIDLLRLTVMRHGATDRLWYNASPAGGE